MTASVFGWLDYSDNERAEIFEILNLFRERGTQDELGAAQIRDAFSDHFFPGTTYGQSRVRYFLFAPWIQLEIERAHIPETQRDGRHRELHVRLIDSLTAGGETEGIIGIYARQTLRSLPLGIFWSGLIRWGIRLSGESVERYHDFRLNTPNETDRVRVSEGGELIAQERWYWHPAIPAPPDDLYNSATFSLTHDEAEFLQERIIESCPGTLLEGCLSHPVSNIEAARFPWDLGGLESLDETLQTDIEYARRFALFAEGTAILYNLMLAEFSVRNEIEGRERLTEQYRESFAAWADEVISEQDSLHSWDRSAFWLRVSKLRPTLRPATRLFFDRWIGLATSNPHSLPSSQEARLLISNRERQLKGSLARLHHRRPLERWGGYSGLGRTTYRWPVARRHLLDIFQGLGKPPGVDHA